MRRSTLPIVVALGTTLLLPVQPATATTIPEQPLAEGSVQQVGPGIYFTATDTFQINEVDSPFGLIGRRHTVVEEGGISTPQSAPDTRSDMGVFGNGWEAEFLGGQLNRQITAGSGAYTVIDLNADQATTYTFTDSLDTPDGGSIATYSAADGSTLTETSSWDDNIGIMTTTIKEVINADLTSAATGDDTFAATAADLKPTYTYKQAAPGSDTWRVTSVGTTATGAETVAYDSTGRVSSIDIPASTEDPAQKVTVAYATTTTATTSTNGDYASRVKAIDVTTGTTTQTIARYSYDSTGLLREVANPVESIDPLTVYSYDAAGRVSDIASPVNGSWGLDFAASTDGSPNVEPGGPARPASESTLDGAAGITDPNATGPASTDFPTGEVDTTLSYPGYCSAATDWLWYLKSGCAAWAAHYGWKAPYWKQLPTGYWVIGINHDHCTSSPDRPSGFDFRSACDMHDYGYGLIGNTYKGYGYYLDRSKKSNVDNAFHTTLADYTCTAYRSRGKCRSIAYIYYQAVKRGGNPKNGANAT